ncbi:DNA-binding response regulator [Paenibacillus sp. PK3_47]|uniref:response regulator transcription factor n=1 Tax=Paenibacillus sp. PK3_47 TaxID=2072642 RepID=UPI00201DA134|nr:response regulator transcription factor [Paenibacillus sp. PK3_47]UQZ33143.1 DNA-binding response regulator [Paenibacillus sp. PK3_47]
MKESVNILLVEDDPEIARILRDHLRREGYGVTWASSGLESWEDFKQGSYQMVLLDLMLPEMDGFTVCRNIRLVSDVPLLMMSARIEEESKVRGLGLGADDYITKPFSLAELTARIESHLNRYRRYQGIQPEASTERYNDGLSIDHMNQQAQLQGEALDLTAKEWALLTLLAAHPGRAFTKAELYEHVWNQPAGGSMGTVTVHVKSLRAKLGDEPHAPRWIQTVWGSGYRFTGERRP